MCLAYFIDMSNEFEFDQALRMQALEPFLWQVEISDQWSFRVAPNGGYTAALLAKAIANSLPQHPDPVSVTTQFVLPAKPGPAVVKVVPLRIGGRLAQMTATLEQDGEVKTQQSATFADFSKLKGLSHFEIEAPNFPAMEHCEPLLMNDASFRERTDARWFTEYAGLFPAGGAKAMANGAWVQFADLRPADPFALLVFADAIPRAVGMRSGALGWIPTVEMTVQILQKPKPGPIAYLSKSRAVVAGIAEESGELWDSENRLVAVHRQSAVPRISDDVIAKNFT